MAGRALYTNLSQVTRRVRLFGNIVGWVLGDVYRNAKGQFVLIFALSVLGVIARLGAIGSGDDGRHRRADSTAAPSHFALALHLGDQAPDAVLTLRSISLRAIPLGRHYKGALAEGSSVA